MKQIGNIVSRYLAVLAVCAVMFVQAAFGVTDYDDFTAGLTTKLAAMLVFLGAAAVLGLGVYGLKKGITLAIAFVGRILNKG